MNARTRWAVGYAVLLIVMVVLDLIWLGLVAQPLYQQGIGHLMADEPRIGFALLFYLTYALGLTVFVLAPAPAGQGLAAVAWRGALFGLFAYATYDLTNLATLRGWPVGVAMLDIGWGMLVSGVSVLAGRWAMLRVTRASI